MKRTFEKVILSGDHRLRKVDVIVDDIRISFLKYLNFTIVPLS